MFLQFLTTGRMVVGWDEVVAVMLLTSLKSKVFESKTMILSKTKILSIKSMILSHKI
jgi:hypothetical protein